jgi:hypothetical protein
MCHEGGGAKTHPATAVRAGSFCLAFGEGLLLGQKQMILPRGGKPVREMLVWRPWNELVDIEGIDRLKLLACVKQLRKLVSRVLNLSKYVFARFFRVQYDRNQKIDLGPNSIMGVHKVTDELAGVEIARGVSTRIGAKEQRHVEARLIRAINNRRTLTKPVENVPTMRALGRISSQRSTPFRAPVVAGSLTEVLVNSEKATGIRSDRWNRSEIPISSSPASL